MNVIFATNTRDENMKMQTTTTSAVIGSIDGETENTVRVQLWHSVKDADEYAAIVAGIVREATNAGVMPRVMDLLKNGHAGSETKYQG